MSLSFDPQRGMIVVPAVIGGPDGEVKVRLILDTGAAGTVISVHFLAAVGHDPALASQRVQLTTASSELIVPRVRVDRLSALGAERSHFPVVCHTLPPSTDVDGVLGLDFFRGMRLVVDFREGVVSLD